MKAYDTYKKLQKLLAGGLYLLLISLSMIPIHSPSKWPYLRVISSIGVVIASYDGLLPINDGY